MPSKRLMTWLLLGSFWLGGGCHVVQDFVEKGARLQQEGEWEAAIEEYTRAIETDPEYADAYMRRGDLWFSLGEHVKAIVDFSRVIEINPLLADAFIRRGIARMESGDCGPALADFDRAIELDPFSVRAYNCRGELLAGEDDLTGALDSYSQAIRVDPANALAFYNRGLIRERMKQYAEAIRDYESAAALSPELAHKARQRIDFCRRNLRAPLRGMAVASPTIEFLEGRRSGRLGGSLRMIHGFSPPDVQEPVPEITADVEGQKDFGPQAVESR
jgi:tetratricopeptide (TPR) repeat protein